MPIPLDSTCQLSCRIFPPMYIKSIYLHFSLSIWTTFQLPTFKNPSDDNVLEDHCFVKWQSFGNTTLAISRPWEVRKFNGIRGSTMPEICKFADFNHGFSVMQIPKTNKWSPDLFPRLQDVRKTYDSCGPKLRKYMTELEIWMWTMIHVL